MQRQYITLLIVFLGFTIASTLTADWSPWVEAVLGILLVLGIFLERHAVAAERWQSPLTWLSLLIASLMVVLPWSGDRYASMNTVLYWVVGVGFLFLARTLDRVYRSRLLFALTVIAGAGGLWAIVDFAVITKLDRAAGLLSNANAFGGYVVLFLPLAIAGIVFFRGWQKWVAVVASAALLVAICLSFSLTGMLSLLIAAGFWLVRQPRVRALRLLKWSSVGLVALAIGVSGFRFAQSHDLRTAWRLDQVITGSHFQSSFLQRWQFITVGASMVYANPLAGVGPGAYQLAFSQYATSRLEQPRYAHNAYLELAAEGGVVVFALALCSFWVLARAVVLGLRRESNDRVLVTGIAVGLLASGVHALTDFAWHFPAVWLGFWLLAGLIIPRAEVLPSRSRTRVLRWAVAGACVIVLLRGVGVAVAFLPLQRGDIALENGDISTVIASYQQGLRWDPNPAVMAKLANAIWLARPEGSASFAEAAAVVERARWWAPVNYAIYVADARIAAAQKDDVRADAQYRKVIALDRHFHPEITAEFINFLNARGREAEAEAITAEAERAYVGILPPGGKLFFAK